MLLVVCFAHCCAEVGFYVEGPDVRILGAAKVSDLWMLWVKGRLNQFLATLPSVFGSQRRLSKRFESHGVSPFGPSACTSRYDGFKHSSIMLKFGASNFQAMC